MREFLEMAPGLELPCTEQAEQWRAGPALSLLCLSALCRCSLPVALLLARKIQIGSGRANNVAEPHPWFRGQDPLNMQKAEPAKNSIFRRFGCDFKIRSTVRSLDFSWPVQSLFRPAKIQLDFRASNPCKILEFGHTRSLFGSN